VFEEMAYPWEILPGISGHIGELPWHLNPTVISRLRRLKPQILFTAGGWNMPTALLASSRLLCGPMRRIFWSEGHADAVINPTGAVAWLRHRALRAWDAFAVPNQASADFLTAELGHTHPLLPLPNSVDDPFYTAARTLDKGQLRRQAGISADTTLFVCVAALEARKGVAELVAAMQLLAATHPDAHLVLVGEGSLRHELQGSAPANVRLVGQQDRHTVRNWLAAADAFVLPTKRDSNPLVVIEAAFAGLPLIVSHKAGNQRELVQEGVSGLVIPAVEADAIAELLRTFCQMDAQTRVFLGNGALQLARRGFRQQTVVNNFVTALLAQEMTA
jgi:glycosyltransferase involved in cell wall biosynthesis